MFCISFFRMTLYMHAVAKSLPPPVSNLSNFASWKRCLTQASLQLSAEGHQHFHKQINPSNICGSWEVVAPALWAGLTWLSWAGFALPLPISHQQQCLLHLPRTNTTPEPTGNHCPLFLDPCSIQRARGEHKRWAGWAATANQPHASTWGGALNSEIPALKCRYCTTTLLK